MDIGDYRREYMSEGIDKATLNADPIKQFETWFKQASDLSIQDPNAFSLATANADGWPSVRTVLLKLFDHQGFVFFTNYNSRKAQDIKENAKAAMLFPWLQLNRQIRVEGHIERISGADSLKYFASRPRGSQLGAWCSDQSEVIESRNFLEQKYREAADKFKRGAIPLPSFWGGYRIVPKTIEFWQGRENRLHDRIVYRALDASTNSSTDASSVWERSRLAP